MNCDCGHTLAEHTDRGEQDAGLCLHRCSCPEFVESESESTPPLLPDDGTAVERLARLRHEDTELDGFICRHNNQYPAGTDCGRYALDFIERLREGGQPK